MYVGSVNGRAWGEGENAGVGHVIIHRAALDHRHVYKIVSLSVGHEIFG